jgi:hypothetical protein
MRIDLGIGFVGTDDRFYPIRMQSAGLKEVGIYTPLLYKKRSEHVEAVLRVSGG